MVPIQVIKTRPPDEGHLGHCNAIKAGDESAGIKKNLENRTLLKVCLQHRRLIDHGQINVPRDHI